MRRLLPTVLVSAGLLLTACAGPDDWSRSRPVPAPAGALAAGFTDPSAPPTPEAVITPAPGSWESVHPAPGYRVVLLTTTAEGPAAIRDWASDESVSLKTVTADMTKPIDAIVEAMNLRPDLIITDGDALAEPLALVSPSHLDQQFLIVGGRIPEPTGNVTAVDWTGGDRSADGIRAGVAAVLHDVTGVILWLDR